MAELKPLQKEAERLLRRGEAQPAFNLYLELLAHTDAPAAAYDSWISGAERAADRLPDSRLAAYLALYRRDVAAAAGFLPRDRFPLELAVTRSLAATREPEHKEAAVLFEQAGRLVLAARACVAAGDFGGAVRCYRQLLLGGRLGSYEQALVHFQLAAVHKKQDPNDRESERHAGMAQELLEALADEYESAFLIERALDCYRLYIRLGQVMHRFENIVEGYIGCLRLLKEERDTLDVLRHYEELLSHAGEAGEYHLIAQQCREAALYLGRVNSPWAALYHRRGAEALLLAAAENRARGGAVQLGESALLQAAAAFHALGDFAALRATFAKLAELFASDAARREKEAEEKQQRYAQLVTRYPMTNSGFEIQTAPPLPPYVTKLQAQPPVWDLDLVEWEAAGDPAAVCLSLLGDRGRPQLVRRHALRVLLLSAQPAERESSSNVRLQKIVQSLGSLYCYEALRPLERLFDAAASRGCGGEPLLGAARLDRDAWQSQNNPTPETLLRRAIIQVLPRLPFRRALPLIVRGLRDVDLGVYTASLDALLDAYFPDAVSGLIRLYRTPQAAGPGPLFEIRRAILQALGRSHDPRAAELLRDVLQSEGEPLRSEAARYLAALQGV